MKEMFKLCACLLLSIISLEVVAQEISYTYYDDNWQVTEKEYATFYRKAIIKDDFLTAEDYYKNGNNLQMTGKYKLGKDTTKEGKFIYYFENGRVKTEGFYKNDNEDGEWQRFYSNGNKLSSGKYLEGYKVGYWEYWYENGSKSASEEFSNSLEQIKAFEQLDSLGKPIRSEGKLDGTSIYYFENGQISAKEEWKGVAKFVEFWNEQGQKVPVRKDDNGEYILIEMPHFDGNLGKYLSSTIKYPAKSRKNGRQGRVVLKFVVDKDGTIDNAQVIKSAGDKLLDEEALRVVNLMSGMWKPGKQHNKSIKVYYTLPVSFKLND